MEDIMTLEGLQERLKPFLKLLLLEIIEAFREAQRGEACPSQYCKSSNQGGNNKRVTAQESEQCKDAINYNDAIPSESEGTLHHEIPLRNRSPSPVSAEALEENNTVENMLSTTTVMTYREIQNFYPEIRNKQHPNLEQVHRPEEERKEGVLDLSWMKDEGESACEKLAQILEENTRIKSEVDEEAVELDAIQSFQPGSSLLEVSEIGQSSIEFKSSSLEQDENQPTIPSLTPQNALVSSEVDAMQKKMHLIKTQNQDTNNSSSHSYKSLDSSPSSGVDSHHNSFVGCPATDKDERPSETDPLNMESPGTHVLNSCSGTNKENPQPLLSCLRPLAARPTTNTTHLNTSRKDPSPIPGSNDKTNSLSTNYSVRRCSVQLQKCQNIQYPLISQKKLHICRDCGKNFRFKWLLLRHQHLIHKCKPPYSCPLCPKVFTKHKTLQKHMQRHYKRPYRCSECLKSYRIREKLKLHWKTHAGEAPFSCRLCGFTCRTLKRLDSHLSNIAH